MIELLEGIVSHSRDEYRHLILADWLEEYDDPRRAELLRLHRQLLTTCCEPDSPEREGQQKRMAELLAEGVRPCLPQRTVVLSKGVEMTLNFIPPGTFLMGSPEDELRRDGDETLYRVTLTRGFWMSVHQVTQAQWQTVLESNPSHFHGPSRPVERISWLDCQAFCQQLSERTGLAFRLPTEAEWEYACRAGTTTAYHTGDDDAALGLAGWYDRNSDSQTHPVGQKAANAFGLYDMHGNVWEWCSDWYAPYQTKREEVPSQAGNPFRVIRGGSWYSYARCCRSAYRDRFGPGFRFPLLGFRVALSV